MTEKRLFRVGFQSAVEDKFFHEEKAVFHSYVMISLEESTKEMEVFLNDLWCIKMGG